VLFPFLLIRGLSFLDSC